MRVIFKLCLATIIYYVWTASMFASNAFAQSNEYKVYTQAQQSYCAKMAGKYCEKAKAPYYQFLNLHRSLPVASIDAFMQYCQMQNYNQVCMDLCSHEQYCDIFATSDSTATAICARKCTSELGGLYRKTPEYAKEKAEADRLARQQEQERARKAAEDKIRQEHLEAELEAELAQKRIQEAEEKRRQEEKYREEQRIRAENETQKAKDNMGLLSQEIHNELKFNLNNSKVDGVDIKNVCICKCLSYNKIRQLVDEFISEFSFVNDGSRLANALPYDLENLQCTGFGAAMQYSKYIKAFDKHRISEEPHIVVCDNICSDVVKDQPKKQSLNGFLSGKPNSNTPKKSDEKNKLPIKKLKLPF